MNYSAIRSRARENLANNWWLSVGAAALAWLLGGILAGSSFIPAFDLNGDGLNWNQIQMMDNVTFTITAIPLVSFIIGGVIQLGYTRFLLNQHDRQMFQLSDLFSQFDRFGQGFAQSFLRGLYIFLWSMLLIIPGVVKTYSYSMTPFIMADHPEMTANEAITASREMMDGHKGDLFMLDLTFIGWALLAALTLNIGNLWLNPYKNAAYAAFYREISGTPRIIIEG